MIPGLITVVVPFLNHKDYVERCWDNLQKQTFSNFELLFVDNGSSDGSNEIANSLAKRYPEKIKLHYEQQKGIPFARNKGLEKAAGEFISFLDIDDNFTNDKLERLHKLLLKYPEAAMAYGQTKRIYINTGRIIIQDSGKAKKGLNFPPDLANDWAKSFFRLPQTGATLTKTHLAKQIGGFTENLLLGNDDVGFHLNLAIKFPIIFEPFIAVEYFRHEKSEGARLNQSVSVHLRYFDAYNKFVFPIGQNYFNQTKDITLFGIAQRAVFNNYIYILTKNHPSSLKLSLPSGIFRVYSYIIILYKIFPYPIAHFFRKIILKYFTLVNPKKYGG